MRAEGITPRPSQTTAQVSPHHPQSLGHHQCSEKRVAMARVTCDLTEPVAKAPLTAGPRGEDGQQEGTGRAQACPQVGWPSCRSLGSSRTRGSHATRRGLRNSAPRCHCVLGTPWSPRTVWPRKKGRATVFCLETTLPGAPKGPLGRTSSESKRAVGSAWAGAQVPL